MAEFCMQCSIENFGEDFGDMAGIGTPESDAQKLYPILLCESCGPVQVDSAGRRVHEKGE
jgi:hypothetical protein